MYPYITHGGMNGQIKSRSVKRIEKINLFLNLIKMN